MSDSEKPKEINFSSKSRRFGKNRRNRRREIGIDRESSIDWRDYRTELDPFNLEMLEGFELEFSE